MISPHRLIPPRVGLSIVLAILVLPYAVCCASQHADPRRPPNIVLILVDDLGWMDLSCQGSKYYETPNIDRLARQSMRFTDGYAACAVCSPTRAAWLTGRYPARIGVTDWIRASFQLGGRQRTEADRPPAYQTRSKRKLLCPNNPYWMEHSEVTLAEELKRAGFVTCHIGKWHLGYKDWYPPAQGFDINIGGCDFGQPPSYFDPYQGTRGKPWNNNTFRIPTLQPRKKGEYLTDREADEASRFIHENKDRPFFLNLCHYAVHTPLQARKNLIHKYQAKPKHGQINATYAAMIESVDDSVGRVMAALEDAGVADHTLVIFSSDNGGLSRSTRNAPLREGKGTPYEGGIRVPWIIRWPGHVPPGTLSHEPIISCDVLPTVLEATHMQPGDDRPIDGVSLVQHLESGGRTRLHRPLFWHFPHYRGRWTPYAVIRDGDYKLIHWFEDGKNELYNLKDDLGEQHDLAEQMPEKAAAMNEALSAWLVGVGAKVPKPNPDVAAR